MWRLSTQDKDFSDSVNKFLLCLRQNTHEKAIRRRIFKLLIPVRLATHQWSTKIPLCEICEIICHSSNNSIKKIMPIGDTYLATRQLLHCKQRNIFIICKQFNIFVIIHVHSLHHYLQREEEMNLEILTLGELSKIQLEILLKKNPSLYYPRDT
jgi:hypothetical protein